jgi:phenylalanyl-tRNA synthetase beta chain
MKISLSWLSEFIPVDRGAAGVEALVEQLTMLGFEVEGVQRIERGLEGVVAARIERVEPHPGADRLRLVTVDHGAEPLTLVCGAPNAAEGLTVPLARLGARLPGLDNQPLKKARIRGVESEGMLCSEVELGLSDDHSGLLVLDAARWRPGDPLARDFGLSDVVLDLEITQNRGDALSILGIARDLAALNGWPPARPALPAAPGAESGPSLRVTIAPDCAGCTRYAARLMEGVAAGPSPRWLVDRLEAVGLRAINNVVDATNYVMWELGHPLHAFDWRRIQGGEIRVRFAAAGESFTTLDGVERELGPEHTLICDAVRPVALGGIMGGLESGIAPDTTTILLECAAFDPVNIRMGARRAGLASDSSRRFERGVDPDDVASVLDRACALIAHIAGGRTAGPLVEDHPRPCRPPLIRFRPGRCNAVLGLALSPERMVRHLEALGATCAPAGDGTVAVTPPSWRFDLEREIDLIEEVVRLEGYQEVAEATSARVLLGQRSNPRRELAGRARRAAINLGFRQVMSYSMVSPALLERTLPGRPALRIRNPLAEELSVLRTSLLPSLVATAVHNLNRRAESLRLFELDREFHPDPASETGCRECQHLALLLCGDRRPAGWQGPAEPFTFHDLRESVLALLKSLHLEGLRFLPYLGDVFSANSLALSSQGETLGVFGQLDPLVCEGLGTERPVFALDLDLEAVSRLAPGVPRYQPFSRQPSVLRDLNLVSEAGVSAGELAETLLETGRPLLRHVQVQDIYQGPGVPAGSLSRTFRLRFNDAERSLTDAELDPLVARLLERVAARHGARLRS